MISKSRPVLLAYLFFVFATLFFISRYFVPGFYKSDDGELHLGRIPAFAREVAAGQLPVRWSESLNYSYGSPVFSLMYPLPYYLTSVFYLAGFDAIFSLKAVLVLTYVLSGIAMSIYVKHWRNDKFLATLAGAVYILLPYRLLTLYGRAALGEAVALLFPPLLFWGGSLLFRGRYSLGILTTVSALVGLILSHNAVSLMLVPFSFVWILVSNGEARTAWQSIFSGKWKKNLVQLQTLIFFLGSFVAGLLISSFYWIPAIVEKKYTLLESFLSQKQYSDYFLSFPNLLHQSWDKNTAPAFFGVGGMLILLAAIGVIVKNKKTKLPVIFLSGTVALALLMTTSVSEIVWQQLPLLKFFQLPWRFLNLAVVATALLVPLVLERLRYTTVLGLAIVLLIFLESAPVLTTRVQQFNDAKYFEYYPGSTTWHEEAAPVWTAGTADAYPEQEYVTEPSATVQSLVHTSTAREYTVTAQNPGYFVLQQVYFPGWQANVDGVSTAIEFQDMNYRGLQRISLPAGEHSVKFVFADTKVRKLANVLSLGSLFCFGALVYGLYLLKEKKKLKKL